MTFLLGPNTRSGHPGRSRRCSRYRYPLLCNSRRTITSGHVSFCRTAAIIFERTSGLRLSVTSQLYWHAPDFSSGDTGWKLPVTVIGRQMGRPPGIKPLRRPVTNKPHCPVLVPLGHKFGHVFYAAASKGCSLARARSMRCSNESRCLRVNFHSKGWAMAS